MPYTIDFLLGDHAALLRTLERRPAFVVHCEMHDTLSPGREAGFEELDADDLDHAERLRKTWLTKIGAITAAVRKVGPDGRLSETIGGVFDPADYFPAF